MKRYLNKVRLALVSLVLLSLSFGKSAHGEATNPVWGYSTPPKNVETDTPQAIINVAGYVLTPLLMIILMPLMIYFYLRVVGKKPTAFVKNIYRIGKISFVLFLLTIILVGYVLSEYSDSVSNEFIALCFFVFMAMVLDALVSFFKYIFRGSRENRKNKAPETEKSIGDLEKG